MRIPRACRQCELVILFLALAGTTAFVFDQFLLSSDGVSEVGAGDLELTFVVIDAETGKAIKGGEIDVPASQTSFCSECDDPFKLKMDENGRAIRLCKQCMWYSFSSGVRLFGTRRRTFNTHMPDWVFRVSAPGYVTSEAISLRDQDRRTLQSVDNVATMEVTIQLRRLPAEK